MGDIVEFTEETMDESTENAIGESTEKYIGYSAEESNETGKMISTFFFILCRAQIHIKSILGANSADKWLTAWRGVISTRFLDKITFY